MKNQTFTQAKSERGIALIVVLLLMAVLSGLATGFAMNGHIEAQMGQNEVYYAGARAAAEAGLNRAIAKIVDDHSTRFLYGQDNVNNPLNANDAVNADNGKLDFKFGGPGPYAVDTAGKYTFTVQIYDDDDDRLYDTPLTQNQRTAMGEGVTNSIYTSDNKRLIIRAIGFGPNGTTVKLARVLETDVDTQTTASSTVLSDPALLVNGDLVANGNIHIRGLAGTVHANGNLTISGNAADVSKNATSHGTFTANQNWHAGGSQGGGRSTINVPEIHASDYIALADYKLVTVTVGGVTSGQIQTKNPVTGVWSSCSTAACKSTGFTWSGGNWSIAGNSAGTGTYYVEGDVTISGSPNGGGSGKNATNLALSVIATGSINITGTPKFTPENSDKIQFVTDKDLILAGNTDLDADITNVEGQIMVREQVSISGNPEFQGRVIVQNATSTGGISTNSISGNPTITYDGTLADIETLTPGVTTTTYTNNVSGWMEQQ